MGDLDDPWFHALENAVRDEWATEPLRIREGGVRNVQFYERCTSAVGLQSSLQSIPSVPYLEKEFACHALHLPLGQSTVSDSAGSFTDLADTFIGPSAFAERAHFSG